MQGERRGQGKAGGREVENAKTKPKATAQNPKTDATIVQGTRAPISRAQNVASTPTETDMLSAIKETNESLASPKNEGENVMKKEMRSGAIATTKVG